MGIISKEFCILWYYFYSIIYMILMKLISLFLYTVAVFLLLSDTTHGQYGNVWAFGNRAGVDFNKNPPQAITTSIDTKEGSASIADANGNLLFYTDGTMVWDRNNNVMPNAKNLTGQVDNITSSTSQGAIIIPFPGNKEQYYVFSLGSVESSWQAASGYSQNLYCSIIDMTLNNGLGDAMVGNTGKLLMRDLTEHMTAVLGDNCNIWLLTGCRRLPGSLLAYNIDYRGIDTVPVTSSARMSIDVGNVFMAGTMDVSPDRRKIAVAQGNLVLYDFDPATGIFSNAFILSSFKDYTNEYYGVAFSPDNTKLYASRSGDSLYQFDLSSKDTNIMPKTKVSLGKGIWAIQRGGDGKLYCTIFGSDYLAIVHQPNLAGSACQFVANGFELAGGTKCQLGLPNSVVIVASTKFYSSSADTAMCVDSFLLVPRNSAGFHHKWEDGSNRASRQIEASGTYWVAYQSQSVAGKCEEFVDTFKIVLYPNVRKYSTTYHEGMCKTDTFVMRANTYATEYTWEDGSSGRERKINRTGTYWVAYRIDSLCEQYTDTFILKYPEKEYEVSFVADTLACAGFPVFFKNTSDDHFNQFQWYFGDNTSTNLQFSNHVYTHAGRYEVKLIGKIGDICPDTATHFIAIDAIYPLSFLMDRHNICVGERITFYPDVDYAITKLVWEFGDGGAVLENNVPQFQHAYEHSGMFIATLTVHNRICPETTFNDTVNVYESPGIDLGADKGLCLNGKIVVLENLHR